MKRNAKLAFLAWPSPETTVTGATTAIFRRKSLARTQVVRSLTRGGFRHSFHLSHKIA